MCPEEKKLIADFQGGDGGAFDKIFEMYRERAYRAAYAWTRNRDDALDIVQEAFIKLYKVLGRWKPRASVYTWLYRVIINLSIDRGRKKTRRREVRTGDIVPEERDERLISRDIGGFESVAREETRTFIRRAVSSLPPKQRAALILKYFEGLTIAEIAVIQGCSQGAIKANLFHAVNKLRIILKKNGTTDYAD
ncbi:MAG: RNA polymerase sigma factor [Candidatus Tritonobacter lacicola]|nr:RNA polymerase sigma factor [Candidatus Tritonobacter lacicola]